MFKNHDSSSCIFLTNWIDLTKGHWASLVAQVVKNLLAMKNTWVQFLGWEDPLEKRTATHSSILAWRNLWAEEAGRLYIVHECIFISQPQGANLPFEQLFTYCPIANGLWISDVSHVLSLIFKGPSWSLPLQDLKQVKALAKKLFLCTLKFS